MEMKRAEEGRIETKAGGKEKPEGSDVQTNQGEHSPTSPVLSPVSPVSPPGNQVQAALTSPPPSKEGGYLLYTIL